MNNGFFIEWALNWYNKFEEDKNCFSWQWGSHGIIFALDTETGKSASAKCSPEDEYCYQVGIGVAYAKLHGEKVPEKSNKILIN